MPRVPGLDRIQAGPAQLGPRADAGVFGAAQGEAQVGQGRLLGQLGSTAAQLYEADQTAKVGRAVSQASVELEEVRAKLAEDPDYETHAETFEKAKDEVLKRHGEGLPAGRFQGEFRDRVQPFAARIGIDVRHTARGKQIDTAVANLDESERSLGNLAAQAPDPAQRAGYRGEYAIQVRDLVRAGMLSAQDATARLERFEKTVGAADRIAAVQADPLGALRAMRDPASPLLEGLNAAEAAQARAQAMNELESQLAQQRAAAAFQQAQEERGQKKVQAEVQKTGDELLYSGQLGKLLQFMQANRGAADPADLRYWGESIARGGPAADVKTDPGTYIELSNRAARGDVIGTQADAQVRAGRMTREDRDRIVALSEKRRFTSARDLIEGSTQQGFLDFDTARQAKRAEALKEFDDAVAQHPEWSAKEADTRARETIKAYGFKDAIAKRKPSDPTLPNGQTDVGAAFLAAQQKYANDPAALRDEMSRLKSIQDAQKLQEAVK